MAESYPLSHIIGVDTSPQAIENARANTAESLGIEYHHIGSHDELVKYSFERACANFVFCTIPNLETLEQICQAIYDRLPRGGVFVLMEPHPDSHGHSFTSFSSDPLRKQKSGDQVHVRLFTNSIDLEFEDYYWTQQNYEAVLTKAGFAITATLEPIATDFTHPRLGDETSVPPFIIFKAVK
jgi:SAM-dependent methyltransferase